MTIELGDIVHVKSGIFAGKRAEVMEVDEDGYFVHVDGEDKDARWFYQRAQEYLEVVEHHNNDSAHGAEFPMTRDTDFGFDVVNDGGPCQGERIHVIDAVARETAARMGERAPEMILPSPLSVSSS